MNEPKQLEKIGRYQILARVGKSGMGVLYRGFDPCSIGRWRSG
jgi:hypothetical protein